MSAISSEDIPVYMPFPQLEKELENRLWNTREYKYDSILEVPEASQLIRYYAEQYARKCLEIAAKGALILEEPLPEEDCEPSTHSGGYIRDEHYVCVHKPSIINITFPEQ